MPVPAVPRPALIVGQPKFRLGGLERVLDGPAPPLDRHQFLDRRARRAPGREIGQAPVRQAAPHQKATRPQALVERGVERVSLQRSQLQIGPVVQARPLRARPRREPDPVLLHEGCRDLLGRARYLGLGPPASAPQDQNECWLVTPKTYPLPPRRSASSISPTP